MSEMQENVKEREICTLADVAIHQGHMIARERNHLCTVLDVKIIERGLSQKLEEGYSIRQRSKERQMALTAAPSCASDFVAIRRSRVSTDG